MEYAQRTMSAKGYEGLVTQTVPVDVGTLSESSMSSQYRKRQIVAWDEIIERLDSFDNAVDLLDWAGEALADPVKYFGPLRHEAYKVHRAYRQEPYE
jgi:hypothetical protein